MSKRPTQIAPAGLQTETGARTSSGDVQPSSYQETKPHSSDERLITIRKERGFVRLIVTPKPTGGFGLPSTYSSLGLAVSAAQRLQNERGWQLEGEEDYNV